MRKAVLCREYDPSTGHLRPGRRPCSQRSPNAPCRFVHPGQPKWDELVRQALWRGDPDGRRYPHLNISPAHQVTLTSSINSEELPQRSRLHSYHRPSSPGPSRITPPSPPTVRKRSVEPSTPITGDIQNEAPIFVYPSQALSSTEISQPVEPLGQDLSSAVEDDTNTHHITVHSLTEQGSTQSMSIVQHTIQGTSSQGKGPGFRKWQSCVKELAKASQERKSWLESATVNRNLNMLRQLGVQRGRNPKMPNSTSFTSTLAPYLTEVELAKQVDTLASSVNLPECWPLKTERALKRKKPHDAEGSLSMQLSELAPRVKSLQTDLQEALDSVSGLQVRIQDSTTLRPKNTDELEENPDHTFGHPEHLDILESLSARASQCTSRILTMTDVFDYSMHDIEDFLQKYGVPADNEDAQTEEREEEAAVEMAVIVHPTKQLQIGRNLTFADDQEAINPHRTRATFEEIAEMSRADIDALTMLQNDIKTQVTSADVRQLLWENDCLRRDIALMENELDVSGKELDEMADAILQYVTPDPQPLPSFEELKRRLVEDVVKDLKQELDGSIVGLMAAITEDGLDMQRKLMDVVDPTEMTLQLALDLIQDQASQDSTSGHSKPIRAERPVVVINGVL